MSGSVFGILHALLLSKHKGTQEVEIFTSVCPGTDTGVREKIQTVQGHMPLGMDLVCE